MSLYRMGVGSEPTTEEESRRQQVAGGTPFVPPPQIFQQAAHNPQSGFWTFIQWLGAALTLWVGYEKAKELYDKHLANKADDSEIEDEAAE